MLLPDNFVSFLWLEYIGIGVFFSPSVSFSLEQALTYYKPAAMCIHSVSLIGRG